MRATRRLPNRWLVAWAFAAAAAPAAGEELLVPVAPDSDPSAAVDAACAVRASQSCATALRFLTARAVATLAILSERHDPQAAELARLAADAADPELRALAAAALAVPFAAPEDTPLLAELADDPVPAVRTAALRSLRSSSDPRAQLLARRADAFGSSPPGDAPSHLPEAAIAAERTGVPLPADAVYLYLGSAPASGRYAYWTRQAPAAVMAALRGQGQGPLTPDQFRAQVEAATAGPDLEAGEMPSADDMARALAIAEQAMRAMEGAEGKSPEEQAAALGRAAGGMAVFDTSLADLYAEAELFGEARLFVLEVAGAGKAVVAVYRDLAIGGTGVTVHRLAVAAN